MKDQSPAQPLGKAVRSSSWFGTWNGKTEVNNLKMTERGHQFLLSDTHSQGHMWIYCFLSQLIFSFRTISSFDSELLRIHKLYRVFPHRLYTFLLCHMCNSRKVWTCILLMCRISVYAVAKGLLSLFKNLWFGYICECLPHFQRRRLIEKLVWDGNCVPILDRN